MVELYGKHFIYDDTKSRVYDLIFANVDTSRMLAISGQKEGRFVFNNSIKARHHIGDRYDDSPLTFEIEIVTCDGHAIEYNELREIEKWLFVNSTFRKLYIDPADDPFGETSDLVYGAERRLYFNARFLYPDKIEGNSGVVGFRCTMETDSMMMWQEEATATFDLQEPLVIEVGGESIVVMRGDVDGDNQVTPKDATMIQKAWNNILMGEPPFDPNDPDYDRKCAAADMNGDGEIDAKDASMVQRVYNAVVNEEAGEPEYIILQKSGEVIHLEEGTKVITIDVDTDLDGYTYPKVVLYGNLTGGSISLVNYDDDQNRETKFEGLSGSSSIMLDSTISRCGVADGVGTISANTTLYNKMTKKNFPRLVQGKNQIGIIGDIIRVVVTWNNRRFL